MEKYKMEIRYGNDILFNQSGKVILYYWEWQQDKDDFVFYETTKSHEMMKRGINKNSSYAYLTVHHHIIN